MNVLELIGLDEVRDCSDALSLQCMASVYRRTSSLYSRFSVVISVCKALEARTGAVSVGGILSPA